MHTTPRSIAAGLLALLAALSACTQEAQPPSAPAPRKEQPQTQQPRPTRETQQPQKSDRKYGLESPLPRTAGAIRIATYNIENLFDDHDDPELSGRYEDKDMTKPDDDCRNAAAAIKAVDADVIALQEIESLQALTWFRDRYLSDLGYKYIISIDAGDERGIEQSVLSRFPVKETRNWVQLDLGGTHPAKWGNQDNYNAGQPIKYHRSPLLVTIDAPAADGTSTYEFTLVVVHQKSGKDGGYWREKEAAKTVELLAGIQKDHPEQNIILLGDFNSVQTDRSMQIITEAGWYDVLAAEDPGQAKRDPTTITHASGRSYDHVLLNPAARKELVPNSVFVLGTPIRNKPGYASDHYPVVIDVTPQEK